MLARKKSMFSHEHNYKKLNVQISSPPFFIFQRADSKYKYIFSNKLSMEFNVHFI